MGMKRTLLRHQDALSLPIKKNRVGGHKITEKRGETLRRSTPEMRGTKTFLERIGVPKRLTKSMHEEALYDARYHFTKGWRINKAKAA